MKTEFNWLDWTIIIAFSAISLAIGVYYTKKASKDIGEYFLSGRSLSWWLAGISMVATSFATDSPLITASLVRKFGLAGGWYWLSFACADVLCLVMFSKLWRRANVMTDAEVTEIRYSGKSATSLRIFSAFYAALPVNCVIMGWVILAMVKILEYTVGWPKEIVIPVLMVLTAFYTLMSGMWGAVMTDLFQFVFAMIGCIAMSVFAIQKVGGVAEMKTKLLATHPHVFDMFPSFGPGEITLFTFIVYMAIQWWAQRGVGGGGQITQRMFSTKDEKNSTLSVFFFVLAHYSARVWPWILVGLVSLIVYPDLTDHESAYPRFMAEFLPNGLYGLMVAAMFAAFMSTITTHLNWGSSYLIVDFYQRLIKKNGTDKHYVFASRVALVILLIIGSIVALNLNSIETAWKFLFAFSAGVGPVYVLRWYWHRVNAWSEMSALFASGVIATALTAMPDFLPGKGIEDNYCLKLIITLILTTAVWLIVTYMTKPVDMNVLKEFYLRVRPAGPGWKPVIAEIERETGKKVEIKEKLPAEILAFFLGITMIYSSYIAIGKFILQFYPMAIFSGAIGISSGVWLYKIIITDSYGKES